MHYQHGGEVLGSGGYGCVLQTKGKSLPCKGSRTPRQIGFVSKVMTKRLAKEEQDEVRLVRRLVDSAPPRKAEEMRSVMMLDIPRICPLDFGALTDREINDLYEGCGALSNDLIAIVTEDEGCGLKGRRQLAAEVRRCLSTNIKANNIVALTIVELGPSIATVTKVGDPALIKARASALGRGLLEMLKKGVIPLSQLQYLHLDIKGDNVLLNTARNSPKPLMMQPVKLIDWGLGMSLSGSITAVVGDLARRSLMFNATPAIITFRRLNMIKSFRDTDSVREITRSLIQDALSGISAGDGHFARIVSISTSIQNYLKSLPHSDIPPSLFGNNPFDEDKWAFNIVESAVEEIRTRGVESYILNSFLPSADAYGTMCCLDPFLRGQTPPRPLRAACAALASFLGGPSQDGAAAERCMKIFIHEASDKAAPVA